MRKERGREDCRCEAERLWGGTFRVMRLKGRESRRLKVKEEGNKVPLRNW